jgi:hypothetical protein
MYGRIEMDEGRAALRAEMERAIDELGMTWLEATQSGKLSYQTLRRARDGEGPITPRTARSIETIFEWPRGTVRAILSGKREEVSPGRNGTIASIEEILELLMTIEDKVRSLKQAQLRTSRRAV